MRASTQAKTIAGLLAFSAGGAALAYEVVLTRMLALTFGGTAVAVTTVLAGYMAGLALGAAWAGRRPAHSAPRVLAALQGGAALFALVLPYLLGYLEQTYLAVHPHIFSRLVARDLVRFCLALPAVIPLAVVAGAILPLLVVSTAARENLAASLSVLYALDTLGAVAGCLLAQFVSLPAIGVRATLAAAACVSLICAALALRLPRGAPSSEVLTVDRASPQDATQTPTSQDQPASEITPTQRVPACLILLAFAVSGFAALGYEVVATRLLSFQVGISAYAFATVVAAFLAGLAVGSALCRTYAPGLRRPAEVFALVEVGIGTAGIALIFAFHSMPALESGLKTLFKQASWTDLVARRFILSFAILALPAVLMGMTLPLAAAALRPSRPNVGQATGDAYAANTLGAVLGSASAGLLLLPLLGTRKSLVLLAACNFAAAVLLVVRGSRLLPRLSLPAACGVLLLGLGLPALRVPLEFGHMSPDWRLLFVREGIGGTVTVFQKKQSGERRLFVNGVGEVTTDINSLRAFELMGHLPFTLPGPRSRAVVVAFGAGITLGAVASHAEVEQLDCAEICPPVIPATRFFRNFNGDVLADPRVRVFLEDGRTFIAAARGKYDLIVLDATHPTTGDSWALYTQEFYKECLAHLADTGVLVQWLPTHGLHPLDYRTALRTFISVFPHSSLWHSDTHTVLLATPGSQALDWHRLAAPFAVAGQRRLLALGDIGSPDELVSCFVAGEKELRGTAGDGPINRDNLAPLQFGEARSSAYATAPLNLILLSKRFPALPQIAGLSSQGQDAETRRRLQHDLDAAIWVWRGTALALLGEWPQAKTFFERARALNPNSRDVARWLGLARRAVQKQWLA